MPISTWSVISVTIEIHKRPGRAECHPVSTFVNLLLWHVVLNIGPTRRKNRDKVQAHFYLHFTIAGGDTFSCYLPKLIFSFTFLPLPFIQPSFSSCLLLFFLWIFLLASPPTDIWACNWSSFCLFCQTFTFCVHCFVSSLFKLVSRLLHIVFCVYCVWLVQVSDFTFLLNINIYYLRL